MVADFLMHKIFTDELGEKTKYEYKTYLNLFVEKFGEHYWKRLAPDLGDWLQEGRPPAARPAHMRCTDARAFFGKIRLCYSRSITPASCGERQPFGGLDLRFLPKSTPPPGVAGARACSLRRTGRRRGSAVDRDAIVMMIGSSVSAGRTGSRWPPTCSIATWSPSGRKDGLPKRAAMVAGARTGPARGGGKARRQTASVSRDILPTIAMPPWKRQAFGEAFHQLRARLVLSTALRHPNYYVGLVDAPRWRSRQPSSRCAPCGILRHAELRRRRPAN